MAKASFVKAWQQRELFLRDDRRFASIPQDEGYEGFEGEALILRDREAIVSKDEGGLPGGS